MEHFHWACGSRVGVDSHVAWKVHASPSLRDSTRTAELYNSCINEHSNTLRLNKAAVSLFWSHMREADHTTDRQPHKPFISSLRAAPALPSYPWIGAWQAGLRGLQLSWCYSVATGIWLMTCVHTMGDPLMERFRSSGTLLADMLEQYKQVHERRHGMYAVDVFRNATWARNAIVRVTI